MNIDTDKARMVGKTCQPRYGSKCCGVPSKVIAHKRAAKRRERQAVARMIRQTF